MRKLFRVVQAGDGFANTEPNARGVLPELMTRVGFARGRETAVIPTPTGSIRGALASTSQRPCSRTNWRG